MSTTLVNVHILIETGLSILTAENGAELITEQQESVQNPYSPPVWQIQGSVDKVPWNPRVHWKKFR